MEAQLEVGLGGMTRERSEPGEEERMLKLMMGSVQKLPAAAATPAPTMIMDMQQELLLMGAKVGMNEWSAAGSAAFMKNWMQSSGDKGGELEAAAACIISGGRGAALELDSQISNVPLPSGWEKCLDLQTGSIYYLNRSTGLTTSSDPRLMKPPSSIHSHLPWPTSPPSSSSDLTFDSAIAAAAHASSPSSCKRASASTTTTAAPSQYTSYISETPSPSPPADDHLDLSLSLRPSTYGGSQSGTVRRSSPHSPPSLTYSQAALSQHGQGLNNHIHPKRSIVQQRTNMLTSSYNTTIHTSSAEAATPSAQEIAWMSGLGMNEMTSKATQQQAELRHELVSSSYTREASCLGRCYDSYPNMMTVGCANCLMFVMVPQSCNPRCPRCAAPMSIDFINGIQMLHPAPPPAAGAPANYRKRPKLAGGGANSGLISPLFS